MGKTNLKSRYYRFPIIYIGIGYLIIQLIFSVIGMSVKTIPEWIILVVDVALIGFAIIGVITSGAAGAFIEKTEDKVQKKTAFIKTIKVEIDSLTAKTDEAENKKALKELSDIIRYSDPVSQEALEELESQIEEKVKFLSVSEGNQKELIEEIKKLMEQRNIKCKELK